MGISKERFISVFVSYLVDIKNMSFYSVSECTQIDIKSLQAWKLQKPKNIRRASIEKLIAGIESEISFDYVEFSDFLVKELENDGISPKRIRKELSDCRDIRAMLDKLEKADLSSAATLQEQIGTAGIIKDVKNFLSPYYEYFQVSDKTIGENDADVYFSPLVYNSKLKEELKSGAVPELNYLILRFPCAYHVCIILSNYSIDYDDQKQRVAYSLMIEKLKEQYDLKMIIIVTDNARRSVPILVQSKFTEQHNLFFEFVRPSKLNNISIQGLKLSEDDPKAILNRINQYRYAQLIFERFMSYLAVIGNEIMFFPYLEKLHKEIDLENSPRKVLDNLNTILTSYEKRTNLNNFTDYAKNVLLKDICAYSYLSRHAVYYERTLVEEAVNTYLKDNNKTKIGMAVEICAPKSLTTAGVLDKCEKVLLFTASHTAYSVMEKLDKKTGRRFIPGNVSLRLSHLNPEYIMHQYEDELSGSVDLLVVGFGAGSQIDDLTRFLRYAYNWLSEKGILFLSVYNKESLILNKNHLRDQRFETSPLYISDYWTYTQNGRAPLLKKLKAYSPEGFQSVYLSLFNSQKGDLSTYPYLSALIDPSEYSRDILDEIREADKLFAGQGSHGRLINVIGKKGENLSSEENRNKVKEYLNSQNIQYTLISHTLAPDSRSLKRSLTAQKISMANVTLLKTVVLQEISDKSRKIFAILPYNKKVVYDVQKYELVSEPQVLEHFPQGTVSPMAVIAEKTVRNSNFDNMYLLYNDKISTEYVIMGGGSNAESLRMKTKTFRRIIKKHNIIFSNILE